MFRKPCRLTVCLAIVCLLQGAVFAKRADNRPYVQSGADGVFYARCIPAEAEGTGGRTEICRVGMERDEVIDRYDWYTAHGVVLGWSPLKGKVSVLAIIQEEADEWRRQEELRFMLGGQKLKSYTSADLLALGAGEQVSKPGGQRAAYRVIGCEQVPLTNEYDYVIEVGKDKRLRFDITTGELRSAVRQEK